MCAHLEEPPVGEVSNAGDTGSSNAKDASAALRRNRIDGDEDSDANSDANSDDDSSISTPLAQNKALTTLHKSKGLGLQSVSALGTP